MAQIELRPFLTLLFFLIFFWAGGRFPKAKNFGGFLLTLLENAFSNNPKTKSDAGRPVGKWTHFPIAGGLEIIIGKWGGHTPNRASATNHTDRCPNRGQYREVIPKPSAGTQNSGHSVSRWPHTSRKRQPAALQRPYSCVSVQMRRFWDCCMCAQSKTYFSRRPLVDIHKQKQPPMACDHTHALCRRPKSRAFCPILIAHVIQT